MTTQIQYYLNEKGVYISPCPFGQTVLNTIRMVGSFNCKSCQYYESEQYKTVMCKCNGIKNESWVVV